MKQETTLNQDEISAYLDGELTPQERLAVETRLANDAAFREELLRTEAAWQLLDTLPRTRLDTSFTETTMELVAAKAAERRFKWLPSWMATTRGVAAIFAILVGLSAFAAVRMMPRSDDFLLENYGAINNLEKYQEVLSLDRLIEVADSNLFASQEVENAP
jgi:anti-sigma factor RsiW